MNYRYLSFGSASLAVVFAAFLLNNKSNERPLAFVQDSKVNIITQSVDKIPKNLTQSSNHLNMFLIMTILPMLLIANTNTIMT
ncbi:hypothetical protein BSPWISOXPB_6737 [uncultured Gammaproteobacteria bacterium]|nr:hypothetical protein BSPWISOXPB_6737 [uncultured Gammaproteobacteria bacterium]